MGTITPVTDPSHSPAATPAPAPTTPAPRPSSPSAPGRSSSPKKQVTGVVASVEKQGTDALLANAWHGLKHLDSWLIPLAEAFAAADQPIYLVGGSVRDALLGRLTHDLDFTTPARPDQIIDIVTPMSETVWDTGIQYGTVSCLINGMTLEITTFRTDQYDGTTRNPEVTFGDTLDGDLIRRDFRVNAMALELHADGEHMFRDPLNGLNDLAEGILDTPDSPVISFNDDPLRMLRACRFVSQLGFSVAPRVKEAMCDMAEQITRITVERVAVELNKLMLGLEPWTGLDLMVTTGLAEYVLPELPALRLTQDEHHHHKDVYWHSLRVLRNAVELERARGMEPSLELRMAALLHDIGKPATRAFNEDGRVTFYQHEIVGAKLTRHRLRALKYSKQHIRDISELVRLHMRFHGYGQGAGAGANSGSGDTGTWTDSAVRRYVNDAGQLLPWLHLLVRADCTTRNKNKARRLQRTYDGLEQRIAELQEQEELAAVRPDLDGNDIMEILEIAPGRDVGRAWKYMKDLRLDHGPMEREEAIAALKQWWAEQR